MTAPPDPDLIDRIRVNYRLAKTAEDTRNRLYAGTTDWVRKYYAGWYPDADAKDRKASAAAARRVVKYLMRRYRPTNENGKALLPYPEVLSAEGLMSDDDDLLSATHKMITGIAPSWWHFEIERHSRRKAAEADAAHLPGTHICRQGFSLWGLVAIVGEFGDLTDDIVPEAERVPGQRYGGVRRIYKRLGLAPDESYPSGEKRTGRKIPRATRGRIMGIIAEPLLRAQWRGAKAGDAGDGESQARRDSHHDADLAVANSIPAHAIGPYGEVYGQTKSRHLALGKAKGHADKTARRAMVKALIHDLHRAWHGRELTYGD